MRQDKALRAEIARLSRPGFPLDGDAPPQRAPRTPARDSLSLLAGGGGGGGSGARAPRAAPEGTARAASGADLPAFVPTPLGRGTLRVEVVAAARLASSGNACNAYAALLLGAARQQTAVVKGCTDPVFGESFAFHSADGPAPLELLVSLMHRTGERDECLGSASVRLSRVLHAPGRALDEWLALHATGRKGAVYHGKVHLRMQWVPE